MRKHTIEISPERSLTAIIESDPNTGTLLVQTNEEDAAIVVLLANGKEVKRGNSKKGPFRVGNLKAGNYLVRATKEGYDVDFAEQQAEVVKGRGQDGILPISTTSADGLRQGPLDARFGVIRGRQFAWDHSGGQSHRARAEGRVAHLQGGKGKTVPARPEVSSNSPPVKPAISICD